MNWNSKKKNWTDVKSQEVQAKKEMAILLKQDGYSVADIAAILELSESRIYELIKQQ